MSETSEQERDTLDDEGYLAFCRETGLTGDVVERLLDLGRVDEAAEEARRASPDASQSADPDATDAGKRASGPTVHLLRADETAWRRE